MSLSLAQQTQKNKDREELAQDFLQSKELTILWNFFQKDKDGVLVFSEEGELLRINTQGKAFLEETNTKLHPLTVQTLFKEYIDRLDTPWNDLHVGHSEKVGLTLNTYEREGIPVEVKVQKYDVDPRFIFCQIRQLSSVEQLAFQIKVKQRENTILFDESLYPMLRYEFNGKGFRLVKRNQLAEKYFKGNQQFEVGKHISKPEAFNSDFIRSIVDCMIESFVQHKTIYSSNKQGWQEYNFSVSRFSCVYLSNNEVIVSLLESRERTDFEKEVYQTNQMITGVVDQLDEMIFIKKSTGELTFVNHTMSNFLGVPRNELMEESRLSKNNIGFFFDNDHTDIGILSSNERVEYSDFGVDRNNIPHQWKVAKFPIHSDEGSVQIGAIISNITKVSQDQRMLRLYTKAFDFTAQGILIFDTDEKVEYINYRFAELLGYKNKAEVPSSVSSLSLFKQYKQKVFNQLGFVSMSVWDKETTLVNKKGKTIYLRSAYSEILNARKERTHFVVVLEDISVHKIIEQELIKAKENAIRADQLKSSFLANLSHEVRTPLNAIQGFSDMLCDLTANIDEAKEFTHIIRANIGQLTSLIEDVVLLSKFDTGDIKSNVQHLELTEVLNIFVNDTMRRKGLVPKTGVELILDTPEVPLRLCSDSKHILIILLKLVENAIKYTEKGSITIGYKLKKSNSGLINIYVKDTGIGISKHHWDEIFERFTKVREQQQGPIYEGTGLGLAVCEIVANSLKGRMKVKSKEDIGSKFTLVLPYPGVVLD